MLDGSLRLSQGCIPLGKRPPATYSRLLFFFCHRVNSRSLRADLLVVAWEARKGFIVKDRHAFLSYAEVRAVFLLGMRMRMRRGGHRVGDGGLEGFDVSEG